MTDEKLKVYHTKHMCSWVNCVDYTAVGIFTWQLLWVVRGNKYSLFEFVQLLCTNDWVLGDGTRSMISKCKVSAAVMCLKIVRCFGVDGWLSPAILPCKKFIFFFFSRYVLDRTGSSSGLVYHSRGRILLVWPNCVWLKCHWWNISLSGVWLTRH